MAPNSSIMKNWNSDDYSHFLWQLNKKTRAAITDTSSVVTSEMFKKIIMPVGEK